mgnify:CR=1 FL=1
MLPSLHHGAAVTMSSADLCDLVNRARFEFGENEVRRNDFTSRCKDELDGEHYESFVVTNPNGTTSEVLPVTSAPVSRHAGPLRAGPTSRCCFLPAAQAVCRAGGLFFLNIGASHG